MVWCDKAAMVFARRRRVVRRDSDIWNFGESSGSMFATLTRFKPMSSRLFHGRINVLAQCALLCGSIVSCNEADVLATEIARTGGRYVADFAPGLATFEVVLSPLASLGWETSDHHTAYTGLDAKLGGGLLGRIVDIAESPSGDILVLDGEYHKVASFDLVGRFKRVILGGYGQGPGEFIAPRSLSVDERGRLYVLDRSRLDIQAFSPDGALLHSIHLPYTNPLQAVAFGGRLYVRRFVLSGRPAVMVHDSTGAVVDSIAVLDRRTSDFMAFGEGGRLARDSADVLYGLATPGRWLRLASGSDLGRDLEPKIQPVLLREGKRNSRALPVGVRGISPLSPDETAILWDRKIYGGQTTDIANLLTVLSPDGRVITTGRVAGGSVRLMVGSAIEPYTLLLARSEPYPHVAIVRVTTGAHP